MFLYDERQGPRLIYLRSYYNFCRVYIRRNTHYYMFLSDERQGPQSPIGLRSFYSCNHIDLSICVTTSLLGSWYSNVKSRYNKGIVLCVFRISCYGRMRYLLVDSYISYTCTSKAHCVGLVKQSDHIQNILFWYDHMSSFGRLYCHCVGLI